MHVAIRQTTTVKPGGVVEVSSPDLAPGTAAEVIVFVERERDPDRRSAGTLTAADLLQSGLVGLWADRVDLPDAPNLARRLRREAERNRTDCDDPA